MFGGSSGGSPAEAKKDHTNLSVASIDMVDSQPAEPGAPRALRLHHGVGRPIDAPLQAGALASSSGPRASSGAILAASTPSVPLRRPVASTA